MSGGSEGRETGCRIEEVLVNDVPMLRLENDSIRITVCVLHGAHIIELLDKRTGIDLLYKDPRGPLRYDVGGWYELFPNAGKACGYNGRTIPKHGDIQHRRWDYKIVEHTSSRIKVSMWTESGVLPFRLERTIGMTSHSGSLYLHECVTNIGQERLPYLWGHHVTFGGAFLDGRCTIQLPACRVFKREEYDSSTSRLHPSAAGTLAAMPGRTEGTVDLTAFPTGPCSEMVFADGMKEHWCSVYNERLETGIGLSWDGEAFPYVWLWMESRGEQAAPYNGRVRGMALEPQSSAVPVLERAIADDAAMWLEAGASKKAWLTAVVHRYDGMVDRVTKEGEVLWKPS
ncbi:DUF4432 family protein [Paenibacillus chungangensis]|uniref:DUF4432 family protein n=1 Tax=Paenibacillus chungangensis TaxID=696535 RepID=A0ABW3HT45_9BACL